MSYTAIVTKFLGPTNFRGSRYKASTMGAGNNAKPATLTIYANQALNFTKNHDNVAHALAKKLGWSGVWVKGETDSGSVYVRLAYGEGVNDPNNAAFVVAEEVSPYAP